MITREEIQEHAKQEKKKLIYTSSPWRPYYSENKQKFVGIDYDEWTTFYDKVMQKIEW